MKAVMPFTKPRMVMGCQAGVALVLGEDEELQDGVESEIAEGL